MDDLSQRRIFSDTLGPAFDEAGLIYGGCADMISYLFVNRNRFSGKRRFIDSAASFCHFTVNRYVFSGAHNKDIPDPHLIYRHFHFKSVTHQDCCLRRQLHQALKGIGRPSFRHGFQHLPYRNECRDHSGGLKIELSVIEIHQIHLRCSARDHPAHFVKDKSAPGE